MGFEGDGDDLADEAEDVLGVVVAVGVVDDAGALAEAIVICGCGDAAQGEEVVIAEFGFVFGELRALDAEGDFGLGVSGLLTAFR